jgi:hypothetical protein
MFTSGIEQNLDPTEYLDNREQWMDYPQSCEGDETETGLQQDCFDCFAPEELTPVYFEQVSANNFSEDYPVGAVAPAEFTFRRLPKFIFFCTVVACLVLAVGMLWVSGQFIDTETSRVAGSGSVLAQIRALGKSQADSAHPSGSNNSPCPISQRFPSSVRRWCGVIAQHAGKHGLPPDLVAALIWQESGGDPVAYSQSGAVGLMQIMPSDGLAASFQCANGPCFSSRPSTGELKDPEFNISYGTRMLASLVGKTGSLREALKSYGPMDVGYYYADKVLGIYQTYGN